MKRVLEKDIMDWRHSKRRKPLIIRGARQVGKTWLVDNVLSKSFDHFVKIDLEKRKDLHVHFAESLEPQEILNALELVSGRIIPGNTLLFLDEIQACPRAVMALRYFYEQVPDLHVVAAGSLLEFAFGQISVPVGRVQYLKMGPMSFYEYLLAIGRDPMARAVLSDPAGTGKHVSDMILAELKKYFFIGGMPECVKTWRDTGSMLEVFGVQSEILDSFRDDFSKYTPKVDPVCLDAVFLNTARAAGEQIKYTRLNHGHAGQTNRKAFDLLSKARVVHKISSCNPPGIPLGAAANPKKFKAAMLDIGLLQRLCHVPVEAEFKQENLLAIYRGKLAEQFVAQELLAWQGGPLYYWSRDARSSNAEVDFLVDCGGAVYPIEVKSGKGGSLRSLHLMLEKYPDCPQGWVFYSGEYQELPEQKVKFIPLYSLPFFLGAK